MPAVFYFVACCPDFACRFSWFLADDSANFVPESILVFILHALFYAWNFFHFFGAWILRGGRIGKAVWRRTRVFCTREFAVFSSSVFSKKLKCGRRFFAICVRRLELPEDSKSIKRKRIVNIRVFYSRFCMLLSGYYHQNYNANLWNWFLMTGCVFPWYELFVYVY